MTEHPLAKVREVTLDDIKDLPDQWLRPGLLTWLIEAGTAVASAPAEALRDLVLDACEVCEGCRRHLPPWEEHIRWNHTTFCGEGCMSETDLAEMYQDRHDADAYDRAGDR